MKHDCLTYVQQYNPTPAGCRRLWTCASGSGKGDAWADMAAAIKHANVGTSDEGTLAWNEGRHLAIVLDHVDDLLAQLRSLLGPRGVDFTSDHPAVLAFVRAVKSTMANGLPFHDGSRFNKGTPAHFRPLVAAWEAMWTTMLGEHGVDLPWTRDGAAIQRTLAGHLAHAALHDWVVGKQGTLVTLVERFVKGAWAAITSIAVEAGRLGMPITHHQNLPIAGWSYARIAFKGLDDPAQPPMDYIIRFRPDRNPLDPLGSGFEVLARCTNAPVPADPAARDYEPSGTGGVAVVWNAITSGTVPVGEKFASISSYLDSLPRMRVGGLRPQDEPEMDSSGNPTGRMMQSSRWVALLADIAPRP